MPGSTQTRRAVAALVGLTTFTVLTGCGSAGSQSDTEAPAATTAITTAWPADVTSLDPANLSTGQDRALTRNIYQPLLSPKFAEQADGSLKFQGAEVVPLLAESWTTKDSSITFKLRQGVKFHGTDDEVTASDVKFSLSRIWKTPGVGDFKANGLQSPDQIKVVDPSTVTIDFVTSAGKPTPVTPTLMAIFSQAYTSILDEDAVKPHVTDSDPTGSAWLRENAVGTGPYAITDRKPGTSITLAASDDSWMPKPAYPDVNIQITTSGVSSLLRNQTINYADSGFTNAQVNTLGEAGLKVVWQDTGFFDMFAITAGPAEQVGALADQRVRQAIAYALPYQDVLDNVAYGRGTRAKSIVMDSAPEYTPAWEQYTTDLDKANALMAEAGKPAIDVPLYYLQGDDDQTNTALLIQANLTKIGIKANLTPQTQAGLFDVVNARSQTEPGAKVGPPGLELFNWSAWTDDPKIVIGYWATKGGINNYPLWSSETVDADNAKFALQPTSADRTAAYQQAQKEIADAAPLIPMITTGAVTVTTPGIAGVSFSPTGSGRFWTLHPEGTASPVAQLVK
ncbi:ABC transporter substrate-binding protein [Microlunatus antarcticus]|uniref:Peptide/nickel transport system substrate-binding protein n=1 Tax=Microlunatus antarcticus TaxID=53388 RepID=A0A7W5JY20_9ACTN|nr:ABC transporter substrate-binding protein [Microlunatus antarcticus]MBB3328211.1 peptide/nickel transport system substrate-binding protein [Microlunatus antarcticus]